MSMAPGHYPLVRTCNVNRSFVYNGDTTSSHLAYLWDDFSISNSVLPDMFNELAEIPSLSEAMTKRCTDYECKRPESMWQSPCEVEVGGNREQAMPRSDAHCGIQMAGRQQYPFWFYFHERSQ